MIATHVGGVSEAFEDAAASPITKAATTPMTSVAPNAPRKNHSPFRSGRWPRTRANTVNDSVVGDNIAASEVSASSTSTEVTCASLCQQPDQEARHRDLHA